MPDGFIRINDPKKPGDYLVIHEKDFRIGAHVPFQDPAINPDAGSAGGGGDAPPILQSPSSGNNIDAYVPPIKGRGRR